ncbi:unnamed protein product [Oikopleura dioica]|uniref:TAZ-type domain-containing protein n=1 Tax=Oikopleura dioica TaxID=34765 RepID=E4WQ51_OIKDI|nr:unnamed protein product [Oikopleura dioica]CBY37496.1 unnamed protein product [Oikopleura dioica]
MNITEIRSSKNDKYSGIRKVISMMIHCVDCDDEECALMPFCLDFQDLLCHQEECFEKKCNLRFGIAACDATRKYLRHCLKCEKPDCPICAPLRIIWPEGDEDVESLKEHLEAFQEFIL